MKKKLVIFTIPRGVCVGLGFFGKVNQEQDLAGEGARATPTCMSGNQE